MNPDYKILKTVRKAVTTGLAFLIAFVVAVQGMDVPKDLDAEALTPGVAVAFVLALARAVNNVRKQRDK